MKNKKVALVTGANKGIGFEVSRQLARIGFTVLLGARDKARGEGAAGKLRNEGFDVRYVAADLNRAVESGAENARIVNLSSGLGSLAINGDANGPFYQAKALAYSASKAALNMFTVNLAYELRDAKIKVNSVSPGYVATDLNGHSGPMTVKEGASEIVRLAQLPDDGPSGGFFSKEGSYPW